MQRRKSGRRPGSIKHRESNAIIGRTCVTLTAWGFPIGGKGGTRVAEAVSTAAFTHLGRTNSDGYPLRADSIEKIHKSYVQRQRLREGWAFSPGSYRKRSLRDRNPNYTLTVEAWASILIRDGGEYIEPPGTVFVGHGDLEFTPKVEAEFLRTPQLRWVR